MVDTTKVLMMDGVTTLADLISGQGIIVCTTANKPSSPYEGQVIYVTDNEPGSEIESWDGTAWQTVGGGGGGGIQDRIYIGNLDTYLERDSASPYHLVIHCNGIDFE